MELIARPECKKGHEEVLKKLEERLIETSEALSSIWEEFLKENGITEPPSWPSQHDKDFENTYPEVTSLRGTIMDTINEMTKHTITPEESAQAHSIMVNLRSGKLFPPGEDTGLFVEDYLQTIIDDALRQSEDNVIRIDRGPTVLKSDELLKIEKFIAKIIDNRCYKYSEKYRDNHNLKKLGSWCSYWGNLGHGGDLFHGANYS